MAFTDYLKNISRKMMYNSALRSCLWLVCSVDALGFARIITQITSYMGTTYISTLGASYVIVPSLLVIKEILAMHPWNNSIPKMIYSCSSASRAD